MTAATTTRSSRRSRRRIVLVAGCTQRKRIRPTAALSLSTVNGPPKERALEWRTRLENTPAPILAAEEIYSGDHWSAVLDAYRVACKYSSGTELWVVSAGYGLVKSSKKLKPYSATFATGNPDSVWRGPTDGARVEYLQRWWQHLGHQAALEEVLPSGDGTMLIAAGADYLTAIDTQLEGLIAASGKDSLAVISAGTRRNGVFLPVAGTLRAAVGGTDSALNARTLRLLATTASEHDFRHDRMSRLLRRIEDASKPTVRRVGRPTSDDALEQLVRSLRDRQPSISRTQALRHFRSSGLACEQRRFAAIWARSARELLADSS